MTDMLEKILSVLPENHPWRNTIAWLDTVDSTNNRAKLLASQGAPEGTVLIADRQTMGRGRLGRSFQSPAGAGVYLSLILRPNCPPEKLMHLTCAVAVAMCDAVEQAAGFRPGIKWTNDLVHQGRKLCGILTELSIDPATGLAASAVLGIGVNCCQEGFPPELSGIATSLSIETGREIRRADVAAAMIQALYAMNQHLMNRDSMMTRYRQDCVTIGREVSLVGADQTVRHAKALDVDDEGALVVAFPDGTSAHVTSGEVSVRGMYGYL